MALFDFFKSKPEIITPDKATYMDFHGINRRNSNDASKGLNTQTERLGGKHIYFGDSNLYPNYLNDLYNSSGLHSAICGTKKDLISGAGYTMVGQDLLTPFAKLSLKTLENFFDGTNTLEDVVTDMTLDYVIHNTIYLKLSWNSDHTKIIRAERVEPSKIRAGVDPKDKTRVAKYYYCFDWEQQGTYGVTEYPAFNPTKEGSPVEIYRYMVKNPAMLYYTMPSYAAGINWIDLDAEISTFQRANIEQSINPSIVIKINKPVANDEEKRLISNKIKQQYAGAPNTGKAMLFFSDSKETAPEVETIQVSDLDKRFLQTGESIQNNVCYAHRIDPLLTGIKTPGSLGNASEMEISYNIFKRSYVLPAQKDIESVINRILSINQIPVKFKFNEAVQPKPIV
jgi:hypothetical protein